LGRAWEEGWAKAWLLTIKAERASFLTVEQIILRVLLREFVRRIAQESPTSNQTSHLRSGA
jgi:hypothetical protein